MKTRSKRPKSSSAKLPPLESGDHLSRAEFELRYRAMAEVKKAELIDGVVYMPSPVRWKKHARPHVHLCTWLGVYESHTPGVEAGDNGSMRLDLENEPQPDAALIILPEKGGQVVISRDDYIEGGPEWVGEIAASSASIDLNKKLQAYRRNKVREYLVWRVLEGKVDWFALGRKDYVPLSPSTEGLYQSEVFPGLWLDVGALVRFDISRVLQSLQRGLASPEHADFIKRLRSNARKK